MVICQDLSISVSISAKFGKFHQSSQILAMSGQRIWRVCSSLYTSRYLACMLIAIHGRYFEGSTRAFFLLQLHCFGSLFRAQVFATHSYPNYALPWTTLGQSTSTSTGFAIQGPEGQRWILTNAHSVEHHAVVQVPFFLLLSPRAGSDV